MSILIFIVIISFLVFVHELGHFLFAKKAGIRVDEFAIGFPPRLFARKYGETTYAVNLIPFGGYVKIFGENPDDESLHGPDKDRSFVSKKKSTQALILFAGILFNFLTAWLLLSTSFMIGTPGASEGRGGNVIVTEVVKNSPAELSGVMVGDELRRLRVANSFLEVPFTADGVRNFIKDAKQNKIFVDIKRQGRDESFEMIPKEGIVEGQFALGIAMGEITIESLPPHKALYQGLLSTISITKETIKGIAKLLYNTVTFNADLSQVSGPIGIVGMVGDATQFGFAYILTFTALISINLAVLNLVPFPALDGGRLLFVLIEVIQGKPITPKVANTVNAIGFSFLILLMLLVTGSDIGKLFN